MHYVNKSTIFGASLITTALLLSGCGGGDSGAQAISAIDQSGETIDATNESANVAAESIGVSTESIDVSDASLVSEATKVSGGIVARSNSEFTFPVASYVNGAITLAIPSSDAPTFAARKSISAGNGASIGFGDSVVLKYDMFSWEGGQLVESSSQFAEAHTVEAGISDNYPIPDYLAKSLLGRSLGETMQVILPVGTEDLPSYLDPTDAYVLVVELL